jgi:hypothetical protein
MRNFARTLGIVLLFAAGAGAQSNQATSPSSTSTFLPLSEYALNAPAASASSAPATSAVPSAAEALPAAPSAAPAPPPDVYSVYQNYSFEIYGGYIFTRFHELPNVTQNQNGFNLGAVYYYHSAFVGADGELDALFGSALGYKSRLAFAGGGPRLRWSGPRGVEVWGHALVGGAHLTPRTAFGPEAAFGYELGGGVDINAHRRLAYRVEADMLGTRFFSTFQYSPKISVGIAYRF